MNKKFLIFIFLLNLLLAVIATPITDFGDTSAYIILARQFTGQQTGIDLSHRSPLFSILMAGLMMLFAEKTVFSLMVFIHYLMIAATSWIIYLMMKKLTGKNSLAIAASLLFNLSLATIYYANILITETLSVFLMVVSTWYLLKLYEKESLKFAVFSGTGIGLLSLARFSAVPLIVTFIAMMIYIAVLKKSDLKSTLKLLAVFTVPYLIIINLWCFYNYSHHGYYRFFHASGMGVPRNITVSSIKPSMIISDENKPVYDIFLQARREYLEGDTVKTKGSFRSLDRLNITADLYSGFLIWRKALPVLKQHFGIAEHEHESKLNTQLKSFFSEISAQNKSYIMKFRFYSLLSSFRASASPALPGSYGKINLNILPSMVIKFYKISIPLISLIVFFAFFVFIFKALLKLKWPGFYQTVMFSIILSFYGINFVFATAGDADRFKYPADPFIFCLFVITGWNLFTFFQKKLPAIDFKKS